ncbi:MAG TPA: CinA family protein [Aggregatilineales bacterium]|nr:CinA family protein [Aggregatilineales bacterium]
MAAVDEDAAALIQRLHDSPAMAALAVTGAGSEALAWLLAVPGASRTVLEAVVPYSPGSMVELLGWEPAQAASPETARAMAAAAYARARRFRPGTDVPTLGVACTAAIATDRVKRGQHRAHVAVWNGEQVRTWSLVLAKGLRDRAAEEHLVSQLVLRALAETADAGEVELVLADGEAVETSAQPLGGELARLLAEQIGTLTAYDTQTFTPDDPIRAAILPGSFNPLHHAHFHLARVAEKRLGRPVLYEMSVTNVDKPPLTAAEIRGRLEQFEGERRRVVLTCAPLYREKARLLPGCTFVIGYDTAARLLDPVYYDGSHAGMLAALDEVREAGCNFLIAGREVGGEFRTLADLPVPPGYGAMFDGLAEVEFRIDISSTELRQRGFHAG